MHSGELWQEYDKQGVRVANGGVPQGGDFAQLYAGAAVIIYRVKDGELEFLFQHRSKHIIGNPDQWDVSFCGHVNYGEPVIDTVLREGNEEIGVHLDPTKLEFAAKYTAGGDRIIYLYFYDWEDSPSDFSFNDHEVEEVRWVKYSDYEDFKLSAPIKPPLRKDVIFEHYMRIWAEKLQHGNH